MVSFETKTSQFLAEMFLKAKLNSGRPNDLSVGVLNALSKFYHGRNRKVRTVITQSAI